MKKSWILGIVIFLLLAWCCSSEPAMVLPKDTMEEQVAEPEATPEESDTSEDTSEDTENSDDTSEDSSDDTTEDSTEDEAEPDDTPKDSVRIRTVKVLFVGNSLTYYNDLPQLFDDEATRNNRIIETEMVAYPNYALIDHWDDGDVQQLIREGNYDYMIVQQGPSSQQFGRQVLIDYGRRYKELCDQYGTKLVYFMVWPALVNYNTFDGVIANHREAAEVNNALLAPVGEVWKERFDTTGNFSYYGSDDFHPSLTGSKKAAEVISETLFGS